MWVSGMPMGWSYENCEVLMKIGQDMHELPTKWSHETLPIFDALLIAFDLLQEPRKKIKGTEGNSLKRMEIDGDSPPRKKTINRRRAVIFDSDEE